MSFTVRRGRRQGEWQVEASVADARTALRVLERWAREFPRDYAEVEGIAGVFATHLPSSTGPLHGRRNGLYSRRRASPEC